ncbi:methyltransferase [Guyparkeria hydrothermalis]|uniref:class I SAM-dependent methyltransferase n=1 Tax=Guyparkeria hydrothermalis TaxID=923 RepID=UPI0020226851|nr:methyltransferase [Guyparkeria hydrothermalis]MCL7744622.1 methyltransferase [Guyparkeria hydrothermalis]
MKHPIDPQAIAALRHDQVIQCELLGQPLTLHSTWGLFSPREIDAGTRLLLEHTPVPPAGSTIVDLGCGYGPIGASMAKACPDSRVVLLDKDFVAVDYAQGNLGRNRLENAEARLSNGLSAVDGEGFDRLYSNVPAKVGKEMWQIMLFDTWQGLKPGGEVWFVSINGLREYFKRTMKERFGNYDKVKQGKTYTVHRAVKE